MSVTLHISGNIYVIWFLVHMCKMMTSPDAFFIFSKSCFLRLLGRYKGKKWPKLTKNLVSHSVSKERYLTRLWFLYTCVKWYVQHFFHFFKILICFIFSGSKIAKITHNYQFQSVTLYVSRTVDHIIMICGIDDISRYFSKENTKILNNCKYCKY